MACNRFKIFKEIMFPIILSKLIPSVCSRFKYGSHSTSALRGRTVCVCERVEKRERARERDRQTEIFLFYGY